MPSFHGRIVNRQIILEVHVSKPPLKLEQDAETRSFRALLDTGATITAISSKVVEQLQLFSDSWVSIAGVQGTFDTPTYTVRLHVPITERLTHSDGEVDHTFSRGRNLMEVALLQFEPDTYDVLLGMDGSAERFLSDHIRRPVHPQQLTTPRNRDGGGRTANAETAGHSAADGELGTLRLIRDGGHRRMTVSPMGASAIRMRVRDGAD